MNDGTQPTDPVVMPDYGVTPPTDDGGMGVPAMPVSDGGMGDAPVVDPVPAPTDDGGMGVPAEGEEKPVEDAPAPM